MSLQPYAKVRGEKFGAVIFDTKTEKVYITNTVGKRILELIAEFKEPNEIVDQLSRENEVPSDSIKGDVYDFLNELRNVRLIVEGVSDG